MVPALAYWLALADTWRCCAEAAEAAAAADDKDDEVTTLPFDDDVVAGTSAVDAVGSADAEAPGVALGRRSHGFGGAPRSPVFRLFLTLK